MNGLLKGVILNLLLKKNWKNVCFSKQGQKSKNVKKGVVFVVTYHPLLIKPSSIKHRNIYLLYMNQEVKNIFILGPIVSFLSNARVVVGNVYGKPLVNSISNGTIAKAMIRKLHGMKHVCNNVCLSILKVNVTVVFLEIY